MIRKLGLVVWKNLLLRKRHWILTSFEIVVPIALFILAAVVQSKIQYDVISERYFFPTDIDGYQFQLKDRNLLFAPNNSFSNTFLNETFKDSYLQGFGTEDALHNYYYNSEDLHDVYAVIFEDLPENGSTPQHLKYKIRISGYTYSTSSIFPAQFSAGPLGYGDTYMYSAFMLIQYKIEEAFLRQIGAITNNTEYQFKVQKFPHPSYDSGDFFTTLFSVLLPFFTVISFVMICPSILKRIVEEKETGVKELMKMMGLKSWMLWLGWMINSLLVNLISITVIAIILKTSFGERAVLENSDGFLVWLFLFFYCFAGIFFCFAISAFFDRPTLAQSIGVIIWLLSHEALAFLTTGTVEVGIGVKLLTSLLPNMAIAWGYRVMMEFEAKHVGLTWSNLFESSKSTDDISVGIIWIMLLVDVAIYGALAWYVDNVMPGKYGVSKPWNFIFMPSYWCSKKVSMESSEEVSVPSSKFEKPSSNLKIGIKIQNLRKIFQSLGGGNKKIAVDGVTFDIYKGEITALLGHNGAGKTTTMSILTGLIAPTSGSVEIDGYSIHDNLEKVRESLGLCPQHNLLFTDLTVKEHLIFFAMLKGLSKKEAEGESEELLLKLNLKEKKNQMSSTLSGGMKRKLSLGIALIGHTKVLMLDEPTSGMDPEARREIWDILLKMRGERTILITTHFMEEADVLGDRIAIMDHGQVQCYGTSLFLKRIYGTGYQLSLLKEENCNVEVITKTIQEIIPDAKIKSEMGSFFSYMLPTEHSVHFAHLFDILERDKHLLGISSIGVSITTLEEVFLRVGKEAEEEHNKQNGTNGYGKHITNTEAQIYYKNNGWRLMLQQFIALLRKRVIFSYRRWVAFVIQALIAVVMALLTMVLNDLGEENGVEPPVTLNLNLYKDSNALYTSQNGTYDTVYENIIRQAGSEPVKENILNHDLLNIGKTDYNDYYSNYIIGTEFNYSDSWTLNAMFSTVAVHAAPISLNVLMNTILQTYDPSYQITLTNHPLEKKQVQESGMDNLPIDTVASISLTMQWMSVMPFGLLFLTGSFLRFPLIERVSKAKQLQLMTGVSPLLYWLSIFIWDFLFYLVVASVMVLVVFLADPKDIFTGSEELGVYFFLLLMYGFAAIPYVYLFSYLRNTNAGGFSLLVIMNMLIGTILSVVVFFMLQAEDFETAGNVLKYIFEFIPHFSVTFGLMRYANLVYFNNECKMISCELEPSNKKCCDCPDNICPDLYKPYLSFASSSNPNAVGIELFYMAIDAALYFTIIVLIEYNVFNKLYGSILKLLIGNEIEDQSYEEDVVKEKERIGNIIEGITPVMNTTDIMLVHDLMKKFTSKFRGNFTAVKGVSFGVAPGECFGLLGVNGAGKTTTFRMLTGDEIPTNGNAWINQYSLTQRRTKFLSKIGYCPQFDAINEALTGHEMLSLFANLRGISKNSINTEVVRWISLLGLNEYENRLCGTYSGGNKRKLSTAMSLIGDPPIIFLDEPTSGVDPVARRNLWTVLTNIQKSGQSVVLTSHSMEECEALCNRLAIMVCGQFMCMGGIQYLKQKFGQGFTIMIKLRMTESANNVVSRVKTEIEQNFKTGCVLKDEHQGLLHYHVTDPRVSWKHLFSTMENIKSNFEIVEDYTISETTLEQVFLSFARGQPSISLSTDL